MNEKNEILPEDFQRFLNWLDPDIETAGEEYERIREKLVIFFNSRECLYSEELADKTINRVVLKFQAVEEVYVGDKFYYFFGFARHIFQEYLRERANQPQTVYNFDENNNYFEFNNFEETAEISCLKICLNKLDKEDKELLYLYFSENKRKKIELRKKIAESLGLTLIALRMKVFHLKNKLGKCIKDCIE